MATLTITDAAGMVFECEVDEPVIAPPDRLDRLDALPCERGAFTSSPCRTYCAGSGDGRGGNARDRRRQRRAGTRWRSLERFMDDQIDALDHGGRVWTETALKPNLAAILEALGPGVRAGLIRLPEKKP